MMKQGNFKYENKYINYQIRINSDKIYIGKPIIYHKDNVKKQLYPNEARLKKSE